MTFCFCNRCRSKSCDCPCHQHDAWHPKYKPPKTTIFTLEIPVTHEDDLQIELNTLLERMPIIILEKHDGKR